MGSATSANGNGRRHGWRNTWGCAPTRPLSPAGSMGYPSLTCRATTFAVFSQFTHSLAVMCHGLGDARPEER
jgi:hypothetical protein